MLAPVQPPLFPPTPRRAITEAELEPAELQDLVDGLAGLLKAAAGLNLRFFLRLEAGDDVRPTEEQIAALNEALEKACARLRFG